MLFGSKFRRKILIFKEIRPLLIYKALTMKKCPKFDDIIGGHVRGPKIQNLFFHALE